jgi:NAD dependent epimerase/dehydratase
MNWSGRRVFVTGADGFIGSHLAAKLVGAGAEVTALAQYNSFDHFGWIDDLDSSVRSAMRLERGNVGDAGQMRALCRSQDVVFHLAALIAIPFSYSAPATYVHTNVEGTCNVLQACLDADVGRVVHTSTSEVYGTAQFVPITEAHPLNAQSPYAASKIGGDMIALSFAKSFQLPVVVLRPFNTYGPRQSERAVISTIIRQVLDPSCDAISLGDLSPKRDFTFVADTAAAFMAAASLDDTHIGSVFNAGSGQMITIGDIVERIKAATGSAKPVRLEEKRHRPENSEVMALQADSSKLAAASGWSPEVSLSAGVSQTIEWWRVRIASGKIRATAEYMT